MGKRGPKPQGGYADKSGVLSTRITGELRKELDRAAARSGRTLSSEIEERLRQSFVHERDVREQFGDAEPTAFIRLLTNLIEVTARQAGAFAKRARGADTGLLRDPYVFDQAAKAVTLLLEVFRPVGDPSRPQVPVRDGTTRAARRVMDQANEVFGEGFAWGPGYALQLLRQVRDVEGYTPLPGQAEDEMTALAHVIADELNLRASQGKGGRK